MRTVAQPIPIGRDIQLIPLLLGIAAILLVILFLVYYMTGERFSRKTTVVVMGNHLQLERGEGEYLKDGLLIRRPDAQESVFVRLSGIRLPTQFFPRLEWQLSGLDAGAEVHFVWTSQAGEEQRIPLEHGGLESGRVDLHDVEGWQGMVTAIGLITQGSVSEPFVIRRLALHQATPSAGSLLVRLWQEWTVFERWRGHSTHFIFGVKPGALLSPVLAAAAWVGLSALLYIGLLCLRNQRWTLFPFILLFLAGWLVLDVLWQVNLWRQLNVTAQRYAGKTWEEKRLAAADGKLFRFISEMKGFLAERARIFVLSASPHDRGGTEYFRLRTHYHLLPHNVYSERILPPSRRWAVAGDFILILHPLDSVRYNPKKRLLLWNVKSTLKVEQLYEAEIGSLYRVL